MSPVLRAQLRKIRGWGEVEWYIMAENMEDAKQECEKLIEEFKPKSVRPADEWKRFENVKGDKYGYLCAYAYTFKRGRQREGMD